ncbi:MAG TPA: PfkB family carbohydrate kinase [Streptosporangiaceae bacterium]|nr:PfkB family carbohydrate kinase [Streptosporangiaceae bacterium]
MPVPSGHYLASIEVPHVIVTVTLNAALDLSYEVEGVSWDGMNQVRAPRYHAAGRGVTVARVLNAFGHEVVAGGLAGGATGELIKADLARSGVPTQFTRTGRDSRRVIWITDTRLGTTACFREPAPYITTEELGRFAADYRRLAKEATAVVLCGSLAAGLPPEIFGSLATYAADVGVPVVLHAAGSALGLGVARRPALVVPDVGPREHAPRARELVAAGVGAVVTPSVDGIHAVATDEEWRAYGVLVGGAGSVGPVPANGPAAPVGAPPSFYARSSSATQSPSATESPSATQSPFASPTPSDPESLIASDWSGGARGALVAGLVPGALLGWSWPDRLRHALALAAAADPSGLIDIAAYEQFMADVIVERV